MKLQFSLATVLICVTVLAIVAGLSRLVPTHLHGPILVGLDASHWNALWTKLPPDVEPKSDDVVIRILVWGPLTIAAKLAVLWAIRRLKSRRHTEPPEWS
jgi:hypothetical protein